LEHKSANYDGAVAPLVEIEAGASVCVTTQSSTAPQHWHNLELLAFAASRIMQGLGATQAWRYVINQQLDPSTPLYTKIAECFHIR
jgi:hypothetical protein